MYVIALNTERSFPLIMFIYNKLGVNLMKLTCIVVLLGIKCCLMFHKLKTAKIFLKNRSLVFYLLLFFFFTTVEFYWCDC